MNKFLYDQLLDSYNWNYNLKNFCNNYLELFIKPNYDLDRPDTTKSKYFRDLISTNKEKITLFYAIELLPYYGFNKEKLKRFDNLELLKNYISFRHSISLDLETVYGHYVLIKFYEQHFRKPDLEMAQYSGIYRYIYYSVKIRFELKAISKKTNFSFYKTDIQVLYPQYESFEKLMIRLFSLFWRSDAT